MKFGGGLPSKLRTGPFRSIWLGISLLGILFQLGDSGRADAASAARCGDCPNPLVVFRDTQYGGDIPNFKEYDQWEQIKKGYRADADRSQQSRAFAVLFTFMKANPCVDVQYTLTEWIPENIRMGKKGTAKYAVDTYILFDTKGAGEKALVRRSVGGRVQLELVPKLGTIEVTHKLIALKNNETYDTGNYSIDWVQDPPEGEKYFRAEDDQKLEKDGEVWVGGNGLVMGSFPPQLLENEIEFRKGDIGVTIRKKETPSACNLHIGETIQRGATRLLRLQIGNIKNQFHETLPNNVRIALKVKNGKLLGGERIGEWHVYHTMDGRISQDVLYEPPACDRAQEDTLEIAGMCEFHDGPTSVGETRIRKKIPNSRCVSFAILRGSRSEKRTSDCVESSPGYSKKWKSREELTIEASVLMTFEDDYSVNYNKQRDEYRWVLKVKDITLSDFSYRQTSERSSQDYDSMSPPLVKDIQVSASGWATDPMVFKKDEKVIQIYIDGKTRKAKRAFMSAEIGFVLHYKTRMTGRERKSGAMGPPYSYVDVKPTETVQEANHRFTITAVEENVKTPSGGGWNKDREVTFGDGISFFGGQGKKVLSESFKGGCGQSIEERTFRWEIHMKPGK
jgi:hypothetical protein